MLTSGAFAARTRLSSKALRLYGEQGILEPAFVDPVNRYRFYDQSQVADARLVQLLRGLDMPLARIRQLLQLGPDERARSVAEYWREVEDNRLGQGELADYVVSILATKRNPTMSVKTRKTEETTYVTEVADLGPEEIPGFIRDSGNRLIVVAEGLGGVTGPLTTIYNSPITEETDGQVQNAIPVKAGVDQADVAAPTRVLVEPAGEQAFTRITKSRVRFPQILQAYDEVYAWVEGQGFTPAAPPREIYFVDFASAAPNDEVCDIAVPFTR
jgi:DNA-binding transcriptional MerR regulator/effector-binding domain-containing protein